MGMVPASTCGSGALSLSLMSMHGRLDCGPSSASLRDSSGLLTTAGLVASASAGTEAASCGDILVVLTAAKMVMLTLAEVPFFRKPRLDKCSHGSHSSA